MKVVYRYNIELLWKIHEVGMKRNAEILKVGLRVVGAHEGIYIWALVDPDEDNVTRKFLLVGTSNSIEANNIDYLDTVVMHDNLLVVHVFEVH